MLWTGSWLCVAGRHHQTYRIRTLHDQVAFGKGNEAASHPARVGSRVSTLPAIP